MFSKKQSGLLQATSAKATSTTTATKPNAFLSGGLKKAAKTKSGNNAEKFKTTGNEFVDQFGKLGEYKVPRSYELIAKDTSTLWAIDARLTVCFILFMRIVTRVISFFDGAKTTEVQRGGGLRHESITRMIWLYINHKDTFYKNLPLFVSCGSWKDIFVMLSYDLQYNKWEGRLLDWEFMGKMLLAGLENPKTTNLVKKYLPQIKANSQCKTIEAQADNIIAKWICSLLFGSKDNKSESKNYKAYRQLKVSGNAHTWQQLISKGKMLEINFDTIHGRALAQLVSGKFITNNKLEKEYEKWIQSKPIAKFTGYVTELFMKPPTKPFQIDTLNKQFDGLVETAKKGAKQATGMIVVRDTSGSMSSSASGCGTMTAGDVGRALALFFSAMLDKGTFANSWIDFNAKAELKTWKGKTAYERWKNDSTSGYVGNTNFQSVIDLFINLKSQGVPEEDFPTGIICISDGEFDPADLGKTNVETARKKLRTKFSKEYADAFKIVLWNVRSNAYGGKAGNKFETYGNVDNVYYFSGYDGSTVAFLTGIEGKDKPDPKNAEELFLAAMDQEVLNLIEL